MFATTGVRWLNSSNRSRGSLMPARPAIATRWMMALVEPPIAMSVTIALSKDLGERMSEGLRSSQTISTILRPLAEAMRLWEAWTAGMDAAPLRVMPRASAKLVMVEAVPIVMQWP